MIRTALILLLVLASAAPAQAYVGPGAGFAFVSSIFIIIFTIFLALLTLLTWPIRWVIQRIRGSQALAAARAKRVVVLGLDGQDPELTEQYMREGLLPNFSRLREQAPSRRSRPRSWPSHPSPGRPSRRVAIRASIGSSISSSRIESRTCQSCARLESTRPSERCRSGHSVFPWGSRSSQPAGGVSPFGRSWATTASSVRSFESPSPFRRRSSMGCCCLP